MGIAKVSEKQFQRAVVQYARLMRYRTYHTHDSRRSDSGFPDLVLVRVNPPSVIYAELKVGKNPLTPEQEAWIADLRAAGQVVFVWYPSSWAEIEKVLGRN